MSVLCHDSFTIHVINSPIIINFWRHAPKVLNFLKNFSKSAKAAQDIFWRFELRPNDSAAGIFELDFPKL